MASFKPSRGHTREQRRAMVAAAERRRSWVWEDKSKGLEQILQAYPDMRERWTDMHSTWGVLTGAHANDFYVVLVFVRETKGGEKLVHLAIRNVRGGAGVPWPDKQRIKNELCGEDRTAVEVFPPSGEVIDDANMYHLWVMPPGMGLTFSLR